MGTISIGVERSTRTLNLQISSSALVDPLEELSRLSLQTLKQLKLLPAMVLKSRELITLTMLLLKSLRKQRPSLNLMSGLLVFFSMFSCPDNFPSKEKPQKTKDNILQVRFKFEWLYKECTMEGTRLLMWIFKRQPIRRPTLEEVGVHRWMNPADYMLKKRQRARFPTNRIQKFARDYHKSRPMMDMDSQSFMARLLQ